MTLLSATFNEFKNQGIGGQTAAQILSAAPTRTDGYWSMYSGTKVYVLWAGTNDMSGGTSAASTYASVKSRCQAALSAGATFVVAVNCLPRASGNGSFETYRGTFNTSMAGLPGEVSGVYLADVAAISGLGAAGDNLVTTNYDSDQVHLNNTGYGLVAGCVKNVILAHV